VTRIAWERRGSGPPLVLVHGLGYARWGWGPLPELLERDFELVLLDNRGIGESEVPPGPYSAADMAQDVLGVLDATGLSRAHVLGTSLGGMVAQELALAAPERVDRLVLVCTTPGGAGAFPLPERTLALLREAPTLDPATALRRFVANALAPDAPESLVDEITALRLANPPDQDGWQAQAAAGTTYDGFDRLGAIAAPTLVLHGTADGVVDPRNAGLLAERIPNAEVELFEGGGHLFFWEQPERFAARVRRFLLGE
jgi:pimeloyl-ACP methyl ester carboxylesterase